jgi:hypothetical protein
MTYESIPERVEAFQWQGVGWHGYPQWYTDALENMEISEWPSSETASGFTYPEHLAIARTHRAALVGDWVMLATDGSLSVETNEEFQQRYRKAETRNEKSES